MTPINFLVTAMVLLVAYHSPGANAFSVSKMTNTRRPSRPMFLSFFDHDGDSPIEQQLRARTCVRHLLTQRAIQSFMYLLLSCRDPHTVQWLQVRKEHELVLRNVPLSQLCHIRPIYWYPIWNIFTEPGLLIPPFFLLGTRRCWKSWPSQRSLWKSPERRDAQAEGAAGEAT